MKETISSEILASRLPAKQPVLCPVCDGSDTAVLYEPWVDIQDPAILYGAASGIPGTQRLVRCVACGMIFECPRFPAEEIVKGYMDSQEAGHDSQYPMRVYSFYRTLQSLAQRLPPTSARVLDIGSAGGAFLEAAERFGYETYGMEPSHDLVQRGKARGLKIEQGTIEQHAFPQRHFDMVTLWDVIEHLPDPKAALLEVARLLKPKGLLLINFPDIGTWQARLAGRRFWWILSVHLHHFGRDTLSQLCTRTGFETSHFQRYWQTLQFGYLEEMAIRYRIPLSGLLKRLTPGPVQRIPLPYYASQTTALARLVS